MKLRITVTALIDVHDLSHYDASSLSEAAANQKEWLEDGSAGIDDVLGCSDNLTFTVEPA